MLREVWRAREGFAQGVTFVLVSAESRVLPWGKMSFQNEGTGVLLEAQKEDKSAMGCAGSSQWSGEY